MPHISEYVKSLQIMESLRKAYTELYMTAQFKASRKLSDDVERSYYAGEANAYLQAIEELDKLGL